MRSNFKANKLKLLFITVFTLVIVFIKYRTPFEIPVGFPYIANTINPESLFQQKNKTNIAFLDKTLEKGLDFIHQQGDEQLAGIDETLGSGACAADFNNDGWTDLFLVNGSGHTRYYGKPYWWQSSQSNMLFLNESGQKFKDATSLSGLDKKIWGMGCLAGDFDNDGNVDLLVTGKGDRLLYKNIGNGKFIDITQVSGVSSELWSTSAAAADFNNDGLLDIYIGNFIDFKKGKKIFEANSQFALEKKSTFDPSLYDAQPNQLYLNLGGLKFKEIAAQVGVSDPDGKTLDVIWQDLNQDTLPDLLITNERGTGSNSAYLNKDGHSFEPGSQVLGLRSALGNRGLSSGDLDNDGDIDLVIASAMGESTVALMNEQDKEEGNGLRFYYRERARENGIGANHFLSMSAWSPIIRDFNNDGYNDIFISTGLLEPDPDSSKVPQGQPKQLLVNTGSGYFTDQSISAGIALQDTQSARGTVYSDFDNDGDIDLYIAHNNDLGQYLVNESPNNHWLGLKLKGAKSNSDGIGATVKLLTPNGSQIRSVVSGDGFMSDSDKRIVFGLGDDNKINQLIIKWPSGHQQTFQAMPTDRYWLIEENENKIHELPTALSHLPSEKLRLKLGVNEPEVRSLYVSMLGHSQFNDEIWYELITASQDNNANVRHEVLKIASSLKSAKGLSLLINGLNDKAVLNQVIAIQGLQQYEDETSIRWLLRLFSSKEFEVKIALADCFAAFFKEEEAVVHRKYLATPYLIRLLDDPDANVRIAAARALGNAERFRGINSLLDHLKDHHPTVKAEIVRTLGLIRQGKALPIINGLLSDDSQSVHVIATGFAALNRLGDRAVNKKIESFVMGQGEYKPISLEKRLGVLAELLAEADEVALFDIEKLKLIAHETLKKFPTKSGASAIELNITTLWINIQQFIADKAAVEWLSQQTHSTQVTIRDKSIKALYAQKLVNRNFILQQAWMDQDLSINQWALKELLIQKSVLSKEDYQKIINNSEFRPIALNTWSEKGMLQNPLLLLDALDFVYFSKDNFEKKPTNQSSKLEQVCASNNNELEGFCTIILFSGATPEHHNLVLKLLNKDLYPTALRQAILKQYDADFDQEAINVLYALAQVKKDPIHKAVIQKLFTFNSDTFIGYANKLARNASEDNVIRFEAINYLVKQGQSGALEILYQ